MLLRDQLPTGNPVSPAGPVLPAEAARQGYPHVEAGSQARAADPTPHASPHGGPRGESSPSTPARPGGTGQTLPAVTETAGPAGDSWSPVPTPSGAEMRRNPAAAMSRTPGERSDHEEPRAAPRPGGYPAAVASATGAPLAPDAAAPLPGNGESPGERKRSSSGPVDGARRELPEAQDPAPYQTEPSPAPAQTPSGDDESATEAAQTTGEAPREQHQVVDRHPYCPSELPAGTTTEQAEIMTEQYGCQYARHCRSRNDGSGKPLCWWSALYRPAPG